MDDTVESNFLNAYMRERLPYLAMGDLETEPDGSGFTLEDDLQPLSDPLSMWADQTS